MKMTKKILLGAVAVMAFALTGCTGFGDQETSGGKWEKTFSLDATEDGMVEKYSRGFAPLSASKNCSAIETTITVSKDSVLVGEASKAVVGEAFDVHLTKDEEGNEFFDFVLIGVQVESGKYYVERYVGVSKDKLKDTMKTDDIDIDADATVKFLDGKAASAAYCANPITIKTNDDGDYTWDIAVTQETDLTYVVSLNGNKVAEYTPAEADVNLGKLKSKNKQVGQIYMYGNAPKGTTISAVYASNKETTVGLFEDAE